MDAGNTSWAMAWLEMAMCPSWTRRRSHGRNSPMRGSGNVSPASDGTPDIMTLGRHRICTRRETLTGAEEQSLTTALPRLMRSTTQSIHLPLDPILTGMRSLNYTIDPKK